MRGPNYTPSLHEGTRRGAKRRPARNGHHVEIGWVLVSLEDKQGWNCYASRQQSQALGISLSHHIGFVSFTCWLLWDAYKASNLVIPIRSHDA